MILLHYTTRLANSVFNITLSGGGGIQRSRKLEFIPGTGTGMLQIK